MKILKQHLEVLHCCGAGAGSLSLWAARFCTPPARAPAEFTSFALVTRAGESQFAVLLEKSENGRMVYLRGGGFLFLTLLQSAL